MKVGLLRGGVEVCYGCCVFMVSASNGSPFKQRLKDKSRNSYISHDLYASVCTGGTVLREGCTAVASR